MCKIMEDFAKEEREEANIETAVKLLKAGDMTEARVQEFFNFTEKQMKAVKEKLTEIKK